MELSELVSAQRRAAGWGSRILRNSHKTPNRFWDACLAFKPKLD